MFRLYDWQSLTARKKTKSVERVYAIASHNRVATVVFLCALTTHELVKILFAVYFLLMGFFFR